MNIDIYNIYIGSLLGNAFYLVIGKNPLHEDSLYSELHCIYNFSEYGCGKP